MSSLYESVPGPGRVVRRWGHWASQVLIAAILVTIAIVLRPLPYDSPAVTLVPMLLVLTVVTLGIWAIVWEYKIHTDPENLYREFHTIEDSIVQTIRSN